MDHFFFFNIVEVIDCLFADRNNPAKEKINVKGQKLKQFLEQMIEEKEWDLIQKQTKEHRTAHLR